MNIIVRSDSSVLIGTGHIMRCLTLANSLKNNNINISFVCRELPGNLCDYIESNGFHVYRLPFSKNDNEDEKYDQWLGNSYENEIKQFIETIKQNNTIDWLIVDHYSLDIHWETTVRKYIKRIMVIDDLANREHDCDILLDQNYYENMEERYDGLLPNYCKKLLGPQYALLREEFIVARDKINERDGSINRVLIFFGGTDPTNETEKALEAIKILNKPNLIVDVVVGTSNPNKEKIKTICLNRPNTNYYCQIANIADLMLKADLAIGASGTTTWERCYLGLPAITMIIADNQKEVTENLAKKGIVLNIGKATDIDANKLSETITKLFNDPILLKNLSNKSLEILNPYYGDNLLKYLLGEGHEF